MTRPLAQNLYLTGNKGSNSLATMSRFPLTARTCAGSALIVVIAVLVLFSLLAAVIIPLVSTTGQQTAAANLAAKAQLLAESGYRYAAGKYRTAAGETAKNAVIDQLDGNYTLDGNNGWFQLKAYSYFYVLENDVSGGQTIDIRAPGNYPTDIAITAGSKINIGTDTTTYTISSAQEPNGEGIIRLTVTTTLGNFPAGTKIYPVTDSGATSLTSGGPLPYTTTADADMFPEKHGQIQVGYRTLTYLYNNKVAHQFESVTDPNDPNMTNFQVSAATPIVLSKYGRIHATGIAGSGEFEARREIVYYNALQNSNASAVRVEFTDRFSDAATTNENWQSITGGHNVGTVGTDPNQVLKVDETQNNESLIVLKPSVTNDLFAASSRSTGGYLSYDAQIKVGFYNNPNSLFQPQEDYPISSPYPAFFAAGLSFRLNGTAPDYNSYGLSFLRGGANDDLPEGLVPIENRRCIVLWQRTNNGQDYKWLAYKDISDDIRTETGFEDGWIESEWAWTGFWHRSGNRSNTGSYAFYYSREEDGYYHYNDGETNSGSLTYVGPAGNGITLPNSDSDRITLSFYSWHETEIERPLSYDRKSIQVRTFENGIWSPSWVDLQSNLSSTFAPRAWTLVEYPLASYSGRTIQFRFRFHTGDEQYNNYEGWYIDDAKITYAWPIQDATLLVRLKEAAVLTFFNGGPSAIQKGDRVYGHDSGALGTVIIPPILTNKDWSGGHAQGTLLLNNLITGQSFNKGETLVQFDSNTTAIVDAFNSNADRKVNVIKVYYANKHGFGTPNNDALDENTGAYTRLDTNEPLQWPVEDGGNWTRESDYFRLIQWDDVNDGNVTELSYISSTDEQNALLRHRHTELQSPPTGTSINDPELGLHSLGDGAGNIYFDDFGFQVYIRPETIHPFQQ